MVAWGISYFPTPDQLEIEDTRSPQHILKSNSIFEPGE